MAQHLIGLNLTCQVVCSVLNAHMMYPNLIIAAMVYPKALYSDLCFSHWTSLLSVHSFPYSHSVTFCMLTTPSCSYPSSPPRSKNISCLQTALSAIADWMTSYLLCFNSAKTEFLLLRLKSQLNKIHNPALTLSNGASVCPSPSARNLGFIFDAHLTFSDQISSLARSCLYHIRDIRPVLDFSTAHIIGTSLVHS